ncbi:glycosyltransferase involved in cell wall biosynthesis [Motilibacter rhizosphaerae]|uniref:Glycosyltransferase involved in cell wall biosynthesis n=1 Tax=Motilibacter rhizosphaerae TaxID=598652 RepID=A0A4Q7NQ08_9ACTN|nr:glycosyltransferase family 4 protein [Motilibacter rhizosphaerae]RZS87158.1 glycosyltransferase involved in cell wall biosynthesis [Motilibacter rhizosphaerae]
MRIAHVTDMYLPRLGGIEMHVSDLARRQLEQGHDVEVLTSTPVGDQPEGPVPVRRLVEGLRPSSAFNPLAVPRVYRTLAEGGYDVVHAHAGVWSPFAFAGIHGAVRAGLPAVVTEHSLAAYAEPAFRAFDRVTRWSRFPVQWTAVSDVAAEPLRRLVGPGSVSVLPNAVDPADWIVHPRPRPADEVVVVAVGRLAARKRPRPLLHLLRDARTQLPGSIQLRAVIVGDGPERAGLERYARRHGMDWVEFAGRLPRDEIRALFARADLFVAPAVLESFGIAALEARSAGLPVIARAESGVGSFVTSGTEGLLVSSDAEMAAAVVTLATDAARRAAMARHNRRTLPGMTWDALLTRTEELYARAGADESVHAA